MKAFTVAAVMGGVLMAGVVFAQQPLRLSRRPPAGQAPPAARPPRLRGGPGAGRSSPRARYAFINIQQIAAESAEGKTSSTRIEALRAKKATELNEKNKLVETNQAKLRSAVMSEAPRPRSRRTSTRVQVEIQRMTQDAQAELQDLQNELQLDFQRKLGPVIQARGPREGSPPALQPGRLRPRVGRPGLDLTAEVIRRFDAASAAAPKPAPPKK